MRRRAAADPSEMCQGVTESVDCGRPTSSCGKSQMKASSSGQESILFSDKLWRAVGLEQRLLACRWSLYHPEFSCSEEQDSSVFQAPKEQSRNHKSCRSRPSRSRLLRAAQDHSSLSLGNVEQRPSHPTNHHRAAVDLGDCALCTMPVGSMPMRPAVRCQKCHRSMHFDCYSEHKDSSVPTPQQTVFCPDHEPSGLSTKRKAAQVPENRRVRSRAEEEDSVSEADDSDRFELCLTAVPKRLRSSLRSSASASARRKPISLEKLQPELKLTMQWPSLIDSDRELTWGCSKHACDVSSLQETGSNQSSPTHADCSNGTESAAPETDDATQHSHSSAPEMDLSTSSRDSDTSHHGDLQPSEMFSLGDSSHKLRLHTSMPRVCSSLLPTRTGLVTSAS